MPAGRDVVLACAVALAGCPGDVLVVGAEGLTCGDGVVAGHEVCDGEALDGTRCTDLEVPGLAGATFYRGTPSCAHDCGAFETWDCEGFCGDGVRDRPSAGGNELCDGDDLGGMTCATVPGRPGVRFSAGVLRCGDDCATWDVSGCID